MSRNVLLPARSQKARIVRVAGLAAVFAVLVIGSAPHRATAAGPQAGASSGRTDAGDASRRTWRAREILDAQRRAAGANAPASGVETGVTTNNYLRSIGKGGAGAKLPAQSGNGSSR